MTRNVIHSTFLLLWWAVTTRVLRSRLVRYQVRVMTKIPGGAGRTRLPMQETQEMRVRSLDQEDPLEKGVATHSSILAWRIPWTEKPGGLQPIGSQRLKRLSTHTRIRSPEADQLKCGPWRAEVFPRRGTTCPVTTQALRMGFTQGASPLRKLHRVWKTGGHTGSLDGDFYVQVKIA